MRAGDKVKLYSYRAKVTLILVCLTEAALVAFYFMGNWLTKNTSDSIMFRVGEITSFYAISLIIILGYVVCYILLRKHFRNQLVIHARLFQDKDVILIKQTIRQIGIFYIVICQYQILNIIEIILKDSGVHPHDDISVHIAEFIYYLSEIILLAGIFQSLNRSIKTLRE